MSNIYLAKWSSAASANASLSNFDELETYAWLGLGGCKLFFNGDGVFEVMEVLIFL